MLLSDVSKQLTTPLTSPAFPRTHYHFHNREYMNIVYRTDPEALRKVVPEPLEVVGSLVRFEMIRMPDVTGLGSYTECGQLIPVRFNGEEGDYIHAMYLDSYPAIAVGRELCSYPKVYGSPKLYIDSDTLVGTMDYGTLRVATATMGYKHHALDEEKARVEICRPAFMLKIVPDYMGKPRICELVRTQISDISITGSWVGPARLQLFEHVMAPMADLPVLEVMYASHILAELSLTPVSVVYDYLKEKK